MNRRGFLGFLGAAIAGATLDPEKLLWEPGKKLISIPRVANPGLFGLQYYIITGTMGNYMGIPRQNCFIDNIAIPRKYAKEVWG